MMLEGMTPPKPNFSCKVDTVLKSLEPADQKILLEILETDKSIWPAKTLSSELSKRGIRIVDTTITKHRTKQCWCYRER
jgi:hypothetical protein